MNHAVIPPNHGQIAETLPRGWRRLILRAQISPVGYRLMRVHDRLIEKAGPIGYSFLVIVVVPTVLVFLYLSLWSTREYESETRFTVRAANESPAILTDALAMFSSLGVNKTTGQDAFVVAEYIRSRAIIEDLGGKDLVENYFSQRGIDWLSRLSKNAPLEDAWKYWNRKVIAVLNTQSNILTVKVRAYSSSEATKLATLVLDRSEALINQISERSRNDALKRADAEVQSAMKRLSAARQSMLDFRNKASVINPVTSASSIGTTLTQLMKDKVILESSRGALADVMDKNSPTQRLLQTQIESIDKQIAQLQEKLTSQQSNDVIAGQISNFEELQLETQFAEKLVTIAQSAYEKARIDQDKQQLYLVPIVRPTVPEQATYPRLALTTSMTFLGLTVLWAMVTLIAAAIRDHLT
jgi:capsular polysaccharide transport system permease protein